MSAKSKVKRKRVTTQKHISRKNSSKKSLAKGGIILISVAVILGIWVFTYNSLFLAANFADNVLRPTIGNTTTISIEAVFFRLEDEINQVKYHFIRQNPNDLVANSNVNGKKTVANKANQFILTKIPPLSDLQPLVG